MRSFYLLCLICLTHTNKRAHTLSRPDRDKWSQITSKQHKNGGILSLFFSSVEGFSFFLPQFLSESSVRIEDAVYSLQSPLRQILGYINKIHLTWAVKKMCPHKRQAPSEGFKLIPKRKSAKGFSIIWIFHMWHGQILVSSDHQSNTSFCLYCVYSCITFYKWKHQAATNSKFPEKQTNKQTKKLDLYRPDRNHQTNKGKKQRR